MLCVWNRFVPARRSLGAVCFRFCRWKRLCVTIGRVKPFPGRGNPDEWRRAAGCGQWHFLDKRRSLCLAPNRYVLKEERLAGLPLQFCIHFAERKRRTWRRPRPSFFLRHSFSTGLSNGVCLHREITRWMLALALTQRRKSLACACRSAILKQTDLWKQNL